MLRVRYLLYIGLMIYLLDLYALRADALKLPDSSGEKKKEKEQAKEVDKDKFYKMAFHDKSRETESGEHLQFAYNPYCGLTKLFGEAGLQSNCILDAIIGPYKFFRKIVLIVDAFI